MSLSKKSNMIKGNSIQKTLGWHLNSRTKMADVKSGISRGSCRHARTPVAKKFAISFRARSRESRRIDIYKTDLRREQTARKKLLTHPKGAGCLSATSDLRTEYVIKVQRCKTAEASSAA